jgi:hypothetical protein
VFENSADRKIKLMMQFKACLSREFRPIAAIVGFKQVEKPALLGEFGALPF